MASLEGVIKEPPSSVVRMSRLARWLTHAPLVLSKYVWVWPLVGALLISVVGIWTRALLEGTMKAELTSRLQTLLSADVAALRLWCSEQEYDAKSFAADVRIGSAIVALADMAKEPGVNGMALAGSPSARTLETYLKPLVESQHYEDYVVIGADNRILASPRRWEVGQTIPAGFESFVRRAFDGQLTVSRPFKYEVGGVGRPAEPAMFVGAPVASSDHKVVAVLGLRMRPEDEFSRIFAVARMGDSGETYAFDRSGVMLTASRFEDELKTLGLIPDRPDATAILNLRLLDPGVDLQHGERHVIPRGERPLTRMADAAIKGLEGCDVDGYRDFRGVKVIGAWTWLPEYSLGVATEAAADEAFETLFVVRRVFLALFFLLLMGGVAVFAFSLFVDRLQASVRKSALTARRLGQYVLVQEIGRGANGIVYRARHTLLRRPVAIKLLSPELTNAAAAARFEHEVQMTSQLTHPNTVAIYDYGRSPEGLFYYAMEYLNGISLDRLVRQFGPQPEGRVISILVQVLGSLAEAHRIGLIHRDVKPANILVTRRGGLCDVVKVLDFGLVKAVHLGPKGLAADAVVGTPHFIPPESIQKPESVDARSDLYSVGAVGYWLVTGKTLFDFDKVDELFDRQVNETPLLPSQRLGATISADLEALLMLSLSKAPERRPASAEAFEVALGGCGSAGTWTVRQAEAWWNASLAGLEATPVAAMTEKTLIIAPRGPQD